MAVADMGNWLWNHTVSSAGQVAYTARIHPDGSATEQLYTSATHTAIALPAMAILSAIGYRSQADLRQTAQWFVSNLPRGILGNVTPGDHRDRGLGSAAPKICADLSFGLRPWIITYGLR